MKLKKLFTISLLICLCHTSHAVENNLSNFTLVLAADMPDIADEVTGKYAQLRQLVLQTEKTSDTLFLIIGGGSVGPSAMSSFDRGSHIIDILNTLEPDVMGTTKREFSYFEDELSLRAYEAAFPIVLSNAIDTRIMQVPDGLEQSILVTKGNLTMGFISIVNARLVEEYLLQNIQVLDPKLTVIKLANELKNEGADFVVLHYSFPFEFVTELLEQEIVDVALLSDTRLQDHFSEVASSHPKNLLLEQPGQAIVASFTLDESVKLKSYSLADLSTYIADPLTQGQISSYVLRLNRLLDERIGYFAHEISTRREDVRARENLFANFITDSMREFAGTNIALINGGSIRGDRTYEAKSNITQRTVSSELPFRSRLRVVEISGEDFWHSIEQGLAKVEDLKGGFPHVSGVNIVFDSSRPVGERVVSIKINGVELSQNKTYTLATTDYLAQGGDGYTSLKKGSTLNMSVSENPILITDLVVQSVRLDGTIKTKLENRIVDVNAKE